eukprot:7529042-Pyramimonas_sp.AAC.1
MRRGFPRAPWAPDWRRTAPTGCGPTSRGAAAYQLATPRARPHARATTKTTTTSKSASTTRAAAA